MRKVSLENTEFRNFWVFLLECDWITKQRTFAHKFVVLNLFELEIEMSHMFAYSFTAWLNWENH